jgi:hypothetical protein
VQGWYAWKFVTTADLARVLKKIDPANDYEAFFDKYYWGTEMPAM